MAQDIENQEETPGNEYIQSAVIPFRYKRGRLEILLISSRSGKRYVVPKGLVEDDLTPLESAIEEAYEEAGITGTAFEQVVGTFRYQKWGGTCTVDVFLLQVTTMLDEWPEDYYRQRIWVGVKEAVNKVAFKGLKKILRKMPQLVARISED
jgi:8-oxo-dGTP pyrophosphatase MutT (NUDIX family)